MLNLTNSKIASWPEYQAYFSAHIDTIRERLSYESQLCKGADSFSLSGWCHLCGKSSTFHVDMLFAWDGAGSNLPNWRERLVCQGCGLNNRMRAAIHIFEQECRPAPGHTIYCTEQASAFNRALSNRHTHVIGSEYLADRIPAGTSDQYGIRNESITGLTFPDGSFNHILSFDVIEHVPDYSKAFSECLRTLKPGGTLLFSVPFTFQADTVIRAKTDPDGKLTHILPAEYHGDPLNGKGCLCFYHFGWDMLEHLNQLGFENSCALLYWSLELAYIGNGLQIIFMTRKPA